MAEKPQVGPLPQCVHHRIALYIHMQLRIYQNQELSFTYIFTMCLMLPHVTPDLCVKVVLWRLSSKHEAQVGQVEEGQQGESQVHQEYPPHLHGGDWNWHNKAVVYFLTG